MEHETEALRSSTHLVRFGFLDAGNHHETELSKDRSDSETLELILFWLPRGAGASKASKRDEEAHGQHTEHERRARRSRACGRNEPPARRELTRSRKELGTKPEKPSRGLGHERVKHALRRRGLTPTLDQEVMGTARKLPEKTGLVARRRVLTQSDDSDAFL